MNVNSSEEKVIRLSASKIEKIIKKLKERYSVKDDQDLLAMCALQLCVRLEKTASNTTMVEKEVINNISEIQKSISNMIK